MSPPPDGVTAQSRWPCGTATRTYSLYSCCYLTTHSTGHVLRRPGAAQPWERPNYGALSILKYTKYQNKWQIHTLKLSLYYIMPVLQACNMRNSIWFLSFQTWHSFMTIQSKLRFFSSKVRYLFCNKTTNFLQTDYLHYTQIVFKY